MIEYLPNETQQQVIKNILYVENVNRVHESQRSLFFEIVMNTGKIPKLTKTGFIIADLTWLKK